MWKISSHSFLRNSRPLVMAHRGDSSNIPENTIQAFEDAYKLGVDCIETDVHLTKDGQFVFFHDDYVDRTTNATGPVSSFTLAELKKLDAGYYFQGVNPADFPFRGQNFKIHAIEEIIPLFPKVRFNLDIKDKNPDAPLKLADVLRKLDVAHRVMVGSFHQKQIVRFRSHAPEFATSAGPHEVLRFWLKSRKWIRKTKIAEQRAYGGKEALLHQRELFKRDLPFMALQIPEQAAFLTLITPGFVAFAHYVGISCQVWTINEAADMRRLLAWGVDGIFSDKPGILLDAIKQLHAGDPDSVQTV